MDIDDVEIGPEGIFFRGYPFPGARVHPSGTVRWTEIDEIDVDAAPPEVRVGGERLFVSATLKDELRAAAEARGIPRVDRYDVWDLLLEPFVDTAFTAEDEERTLADLEANGVSRAEAAAIRARVREIMLEYNAILWDWAHLGMYDLLTAYRARLSEPELRAFHAQAQKIASRARVRPPLPERMRG